MRLLKDSDKAHIKNIQALRSSKPIVTTDLLKKIYFKEVKSRALIIQTLDREAVFYLKNHIYDQEILRQEEILKLDEFISLLKYLEQKEYIRVLTSGERHPKSMYFVQDKFSNPEPGNGHIILNDSKNYTSNPEYINNASDEIIYKGIFLKDETYAFLEKILNGSIYITADIEKAIEEVEITNVNKETAINKTPIIKRIKKFIQKGTQKLKSFLLKVTPYVTVLTLGYGIYYLWKQNDTQFKVIEKIQQQVLEQSDLICEYIEKQDLQSIAIEKLKNSERTDSIHQKTDSILINNNTHYGIDISHYSGDILKGEKIADSIKFIICKATEGLTFEDPYFKYNWPRLKKKNVIRGAYHFFKTKLDPIDQANHFLKTVNTWEDNDITPIVDIETESLPTRSRQSIKTIHENLQLFLDIVEKETGRIPMIYTSTRFANKYINNPEFSRYPLWLAQYTTKKNPNLPKTWKDIGYKIWQKSDAYHINSNIEDLNVYVGDLSKIYK